MTARLVAVTGATGFLGQRVVERLSAGGWRVRALVRDGSNARHSKASAVDVVTGDLNDSHALDGLVAGADAVVHLAGRIKARDRRSFYDVNEAGARRLAQACAGRRLIHVSSLAAREPHLSDYAASKRAGEDAVRDVGGRSVTILRPPIIYGSGDRETLALFRMAGSPVMLAPRVSAARLAIVNVDDVANVIVDLLGNPPGQSTITIGGDRPSGYSWRTILAAAAQAVGGRPAIIWAPRWLLMLAGSGAEIAGRWRNDVPMLTRAKVREACHPDWSVSPAEEGLTAGRAYTALADGFAQTVAWYRTQGWLR